MNVLWFVGQGESSKNHRVVGCSDRVRVEAGGIELACGRRAPLDADVLYLRANNRPITCAACLRRPHGPPVAPQEEYLREVGWQRTSMATGDPLGWPRLHLTTGNGRTCCGKRIPPVFFIERHGYRIDEYMGHRECETCFTDARKELLRQQGGY